MAVATTAAALTLALSFAAPLAAPAAAQGPDAPTRAPADCDGVRADRFVPSTGVADPDGAIRVFAVQMKQEVRHVETYAAFETKVRCLFEDLVRPHLSTATPNLVVLPEFAALATIATGTRGAAARAIAEGPTRGTPETAEEALGVLQAFGTLAATYAVPLAHYRSVVAARQAAADPEAAQDPERSFALADPRRSILVATTDTLARSFLGPHSRLARDEGVHVVSSTTLPELTRSDDPVDLVALTDPDLLLDGAAPTDVWVAADARVWNEVWVWAPGPGQTAFSRRRWGPLPVDDPRANVIHVNRKAPLTPIEIDFLALTAGDTDPDNTGPFTIDGVDGLRFSIANSLPAFAWGTGPTETGEDLGRPLPDDVDPCASATSWMRCLHARGTNVVLQTEANPGRWAAYADPLGNWQPLTWMNSSWRHVADPTVPGFAYSVTPWLVGNLVDLPFDGQASIKRRDNPRPGPVRRFVGNGQRVDDRDPPFTVPFAGDKDEFVVLAPWVLDEDASLPLAEDRDRLEARSRAMLAGAGAPHENDYLETAVWADLVPPETPVTGERPAAPAPGGAAGDASGGGSGDAPAPSPAASPAAEPAPRPLPVTGGGLTALGLAVLLGLIGIGRAHDGGADPVGPRLGVRRSIRRRRPRPGGA